MRNSFRAALAVSVMTVVGSVAAYADPVFVNPNFQSTDTTASLEYNAPITGWSNASTGAGNVGISAASPTSLWDNGKNNGNLTNVVFLQNAGSALQQSVTGFVINHVYQIFVDANERASAASGPVGLSIGVNGVGVDGEPVGAVDPYSVYATPWVNYSTFTFTATATSELVQFMNFGVPSAEGGGGDVTLLLANASILDVTPGVPEPASLALLGMGFVGAVLGRRQAMARRA